jgi:hypothetical protein
MYDSMIKRSRADYIIIKEASVDILHWDKPLYLVAKYDG